jgi:hypothetical protein
LPLITSFPGKQLRQRFQDGTLLFEDLPRPLIAFVKDRKFNAIWQRPMFQYRAYSSRKQPEIGKTRVTERCCQQIELSGSVAHELSAF